MTDIGIKLSDADRLRLAKLRQKALYSHLGSYGKPSPKPESNSFTCRATNKKPVLASNTSFFQKKKSAAPAAPVLKLPVAPLAPPQFSIPAMQPQVAQAPVHPEVVHRITSEPQNAEVELTREECFCTVMDILFEGMGQADKSSKEAAKHLMIVMENEVGNSVSLLVYNSYVRMYNSLRQEYFLSTAANIKAKTIKISADIIESLEQMAKTIKIEMPPAIHMPRRV